MISGLPERLKKLRSSCSLSQKDVAKKLEVSSSLISGYETGERTPSVEILLAISYLYKCSTDYLLGKEPLEIIPLSNPKPQTLNVSKLNTKQIEALKQLIETMVE